MELETPWYKACLVAVSNYEQRNGRDKAICDLTDQLRFFGVRRVSELGERLAPAFIARIHTGGPRLRPVK